MTSTASFSVERDGNVALIRIHRGPVNALDYPDWQQFGSIVRDLDADDDVASLVVTGHPGRMFCVGQDTKVLATMSGEEVAASAPLMTEAFRSLADCDLPSVAAIHGAAVGGGFILSLMTDVRVVTADALLGLPEIRAGVLGGYAFARRELGRSEARMLALTGRPISGDRAYALGLAQAVEPTPEAMFDNAMEIAQELATAVGGQFRRVARRTLAASDSMEPWAAFAHETEQGVNARTAHAASGPLPES